MKSKMKKKPGESAPQQKCQKGGHVNLFPEYQKKEGVNYRGQKDLERGFLVTKS